MYTPLKVEEKKSAYSLRPGDVFKAGFSNKLFVFDSIKRGGQSMIAASLEQLDKRYKIRIGDAFANTYTVVGKKEMPKLQSDIELLRKSQPGTLFVIKRGKVAELFELKGFGQTGKIKAVNPLDPAQGIFNIDPSFTVRLVSSLGA